MPRLQHRTNKLITKGICYDGGKHNMDHTAGINWLQPFFALYSFYRL